MHFRSLRVLPVCFLSIALSAQESGPTKSSASTPQATPIPAPLGDQLPALNTQSSWEQNTRYEGPKPDKSKRGVYPVGNGKVFTYMGLGERANTMMALTGPSYAATERQLPRGHFGELTLELLGTELPIQRVRRVSGANFVVTEDSREDGLALRTLTYAAPDSDVIARIIEVTNGTKTAVKGLKLAARFGKKPVKVDGDYAVLGYAKGSRANFAIAQMVGARAKGDSLLVEIGELAPGKKFTTQVGILTAKGEAKATTAPGSLPSILPSEAKRTLDWWNAKLRKTPTLNTSHAKLMDLFKDWKVLMLTMRDAQSGMVAPMVTRRGARIRESNGPILTFLRFNMWAEAKAILDYYYNAIRLTGEIREHYPLDLDFAQLAGKVTDWSKVTFPESDLLSWIVLQHFWYYRASRDAGMVQERKTFLLECLARQKPVKGALQRFSGHENFMGPTLHTLDINAMRRTPQFIAEDHANDRRSYSMATSALFLVALQGMGDMVNGIDAMENPAKWAKDPSDVTDKPSQKWLERSLPVMQDIEKHYWTSDPHFPVRTDIEESFKTHGTDWTGYFAPAISPVTGEKHLEPVANINLLPLWIGFTFPSGERSRHNLRNTLARLWYRKDADGKRASSLVGTTATVGHFTGDVPGMLLTALVERDGVERQDVSEEILDIAAPAGEWGQFYGPGGRPIASDDPDWPHRMSPNESGINLDAVLFAINGIRHVNIPNFDNRSIKLKLRLPPNTKFLEMNNLRKDGRAFNVHVDEFWAPLSDAERKQNDGQSDPKYKRDPKVDHRRFRFRMELISDNPPMGQYQVDADVSGTMFVRYAFRGTRDGKSGIIDETEFWKAEHEKFFIDGSPTRDASPRTLRHQENAKLLVITNRRQCAEIFGKDGVNYIDTGLPLGGPEIVRAMLKDGKPTHSTLYLDFGYDASDQRTFKPKRFFGSRWKDLLRTYDQAGGKIIRPSYVEKFEVKDGDAWRSVDAPEGRLELTGQGTHVVRCKVQSEAARDDIVLRIGSGCSYKIRCNGEDVAEQSGSRRPIRDQDATLTELAQGENVLEVELSGEGARVLFLQLTNAKGLPAAGLR